MLEEHGLPYKVVPHPKRGVASLQLGESETYSAEELVASILYYARQIAEAQAGGPVTDAVVAVPAFFGQRQRQALADAAGLAGLNLMGLINTHTAAALQYGIERDFTNRSQTIILYDMGSGTTEVALVKYSTYTVKEAGKPKVYSQLEVRDVDWDHSLGSNLLDMALARHFAAEFREKAKLPDVDVTAVPKAMAKLRRQVRRTKEMLSANTAAPCTVEELYEGKDFQSSITREQFETLAADFFERAVAPLRRILERNKLQPGDVDAVELLGGGSRVPRLQAVLSEALGGRGLDRHLDADEAIALGAGLFAANLSTSFRLRKFGMVDTTMYGVSLSLDHVVMGAPASGEEGAGEAAEPLLKVRNLLPYNKKLPSKRMVKLEGLAADPLRFSLAYNASTPHGLPPGTKAPELGEWEATGVEAIIQRYNTSGQVSIRFEADYGGLLHLDKVEAVVEYEVMEEKVIQVPINETEGAEEAVAAAGEATNAGESVDKGAEAADKAAASEGSDEKAEADDAGAEKAEAGADNTDGDAEGSEEGAAAGEENGTEGEDGGKEKAASEEDGGEGEQAEKAEKAETEATESEAKGKEGSEGKDAGDAKEAPAADGDTNTTNAKPATVTKRILVPKTKVAKVPLTLGGRGWLSSPLAGDDFKEAKAVLAKFAAAEAVKRDLAKSRNDLESYIIAMKESLETDELVQKVSTEELRDSFRSRLNEEEDWLYMEADESLGAQQFKDRLKQLKDIGEPIKRRAEELEMRPKVVEGLQKQIELKRSVAKAWVDTKPWIPEADREDMIKQLADLETDLNAKLAAQAGKADHEDPAFTVNELVVGWEKVDKAFNKLNNKKKPKPPPEPPKPPSDGEGAAGAGKADGADAKADAEPAADPKADGEPAGGAEQPANEGPKQDAKKPEEPKQTKKESKEEAKKGKKEETKKEAKKDAKKDSKKEAKKEEPKKAKKEEPKKEPKKDTKREEKGKKDEKKGWSWNKKKGETSEL
ncbi:hypothetical protein GPECTOR_38g290 [Gonium pectorale]|uniref:Uncharacterized protein n=1 Tax=Gonium pectorale TaxID=33097 RepID=A0A150GBA0_GONPE|nr:hypothetical protein GPECTOR_38g290 [Gonium pectorale]|eukprot:KXZ47053.1 hypothetical protein GPECTOR_38g290 [Gonium pectorale]